MSCQPPNQHKLQMESSLSSWRGGSLGQRSWSTFILHSVGVLSEYIRLHVSPPRSGLSFFKSFSIFHWSYFQVYFIYYWIIVSMKVGNVSARIPTTQHGIRTLPRVLRTCIATCSVPPSTTCIYTIPVCPNFMEIFYDMFLDSIMYHVFITWWNCCHVPSCLCSGLHVIFMSVSTWSRHAWASVLCGGLPHCCVIMLFPACGYARIFIL